MSKPIELETIEESSIWILPNCITAVEQYDDEAILYFTSGQTVHISGNAKDIMARLGWKI